MPIELDEIREGDQVIITDSKTSNTIMGEAQISRDGQHRRQFSVTAFNTKIIFAKDRTNGLGPRMQPRMKLTGHIAQLTNLIEG